MSSTHGVCDYILNIKRSFKPLNPFLKMFSLNCYFPSRKCTLLSIVSFMLPAVILGCINSFTLYYKILHIYKHMVVSIKYADAVQSIFDYFQYIVDLFVIYKHGKYLQEYYKIYQQIDEVLGMEYCAVLQKKLQRLVIFFGLIWTISCTFDYWAWIYSVGWVIPSILSISYIYILIKIVTSLEMMSHIMHVEFRLRKIADVAESFYNTKMSNDVTDLCKHSKAPVIKIISVRRLTGNNLSELKWLGKCYLWVIEQTAFINQMFGTRVLLNSLSILIDMVRFTNMAVRILLGSQHLKKNVIGVFPVISTVLRLLTCVTVVLSLVHHCELAYRQRDRIIEIIDHTIVIKEPREDIKLALNDLRQLVQSRSIDFQMPNLIRLDYSLLGSMASIVVTYTIILLQSVN